MVSTRLRRMVTITLLCMVAAAALPAAEPPAQRATQRTSAARVHVLTRPELDRLLSRPGRVLLIDVRRPDEISAIGGFPVYLSIQIGDLANRLAWIPRDRLLVTVSNHAARATRAAELLAAHGFKVVGAAGAELYERQGGVLTKIGIPSGAPGHR